MKSTIIRPFTLFIILIIFSTVNSLAQYQKEIDSLKIITPRVIKDTNQLNNLALLAFYYSFIDSANTFNYANLVSNYANTFNYKSGTDASLRA
jgi:hypothetical protein